MKPREQLQAREIKNLKQRLAREITIYDLEVMSDRIDRLYRMFDDLFQEVEEIKLKKRLWK